MRTLFTTLVMVVLATNGCVDTPTEASAECTAHDDCGGCGRCDNGRCIFDELGLARAECVDERKDPCNGVDDDENGVIDDPEACWRAVWELVDPESGAVCLTTDVTAPPAACASYQRVDPAPAFHVARTAVPGTLPMRQCSRGSDHVLAADAAWDDALPEGRPAAPPQPIAAYEALGYSCGPPLGYFFVGAAGGEDARPAPGGRCPLYRFVAPPTAEAPLGTHRYLLGAAAAEASGACDPRATLFVLASAACDPSPPASCAFATCAPVTSAALVSAPEADVVAPGAVFTIAWVLRNTGDTTWGPGWVFVRTAAAGSAVSSVALVDEVAHGETATLSVELTAPERDVDLVERWELRSPSGAPVPIAGADGLRLMYDVASDDAAHRVAIDPPFKAEVPPGTEFDLKMTLENAGSRAWGEGWRLVRTKGVMAQVSEVALPEVLPGATHTVTIPMLTRPGIFGGFNEHWELRDELDHVVAVDGAAFVWVRIHAVGDTKALLVTELIDDGTVFPPGATFIKTWTFRNAGAVAWDEGWSFRHVTGELAQWSSVAVTAPVAPGGELTVAVPMLAPDTSGSGWRDSWKLIERDNTEVPVGAEIGPGDEFIGAGPDWWFWAAIDVEAPCVRPRPTP